MPWPRPQKAPRPRSVKLRVNLRVHAEFLEVLSDNSEALEGSTGWENFVTQEADLEFLQIAKIPPEAIGGFIMTGLLDVLREQMNVALEDGASDRKIPCIRAEMEDWIRKRLQLYFSRGNTKAWLRDALEEMRRCEP